MDPIELIKTAPELQKIVTTIVAGVPIAEIAKAVVLPSADALGKRIASRVERLFEKTGKIMLDSQSSVQPVSDKLLTDIVRGASVEDDERLHTMWAALLANAASPENADKVRPGFIAILKQMSPDEAALLNWIHDRLSSTEHVSLPLDELYAVLGHGTEPTESVERRLTVCLGGLEAAAFLSDMSILPNEPCSFTFKSDTPNVFSHRTPFLFTHRAVAFVQACRPPKPED